jgi:hypothetical protein
MNKAVAVTSLKMEQLDPFDLPMDFILAVIRENILQPDTSSNHS